MLYAGGKPRYFEIQDRSATEPCSKRIKSAEELDGKSYDGLQRLHEEVHIKKTHSGFIPLSLSDDYDGETTKQEEKDTGDPFNTATVDKIAKSSNSLSIEVTGSKCPLSTVTAPVEIERKGLVQKNNSKGDSALYSTSKVFIGPIYKNEANRQRNEKNKSIGHSCQNMSNTTLGGRSEKKMPQQALHCHVPKIEDELSLFYSEIDQLESNENCLDGHLQGTKTNSHGQPAEYNKLNQPFPVNSQEWSSRIPPSWNNGPCSYTNSGGHNMGDGQYGSSDPTFYRSRNEQCYNNQKATWEIEQLCHKEEGSRFWNNYVPEFVPSQQRTHPFITPYGPPPPQYTTHLNLQVPNSSSFHSATFCPPNVGPSKNVPINMNRSASQNSEYISHFDNYCAQTSRNGCNAPDRHVVNGFCETPTNWKDVKTCRTEGSSTDSQWFSKNRLCESQKLLIILRGLPGAGKTTLSHILLGHSRDGIIFSTDDYFCENNGRWSYNIAQLGAAHDWNQKRAKQAMDEGRSPIIIDNTNTQAWEMKPYVEAALEKGYQVEFHEPDTWWKFIPEELEKRNKHGVSHEKIAQMLERYEYHMSIPIIMNSLLPFHKTSPRPPPERRQRQSVAKKQDKFHKAKQRRKRKRNKKSKSVATKVIEKKSGGDCSLSDEDSSQSGPEGLEDDGKSGFASGHLNEHKEESEDGFARDIGLKHSELQKGAFLDSSMMDPVPSDNSVNTNVLVRNSDLCLMSLSPATDGNVTEQSFRHSLPNVAQSLNSGGNESSVLEFNQSVLKLNHSGTDDGNTVRRTEDEDKTAGVMVELGVESNLLSNKEEVIVLHQHGISHNTKINTWAFFSIDMVEKQQRVNSDKNGCLIWPEDTPVIIHEQRLKKERGSKQIFPETKGELIDYKSSQKSVECEHGEMLLEKNVVRGYAVPSLLMENTCNMSCIAVGDLTKSRTKASVPSDVNKLAFSRKKERYKRIFKLAPNFDIPRQVSVKNDGMIKDVDVLVEQQGISNKGTKEKKQNFDCYGYSTSSTYDTVMVQMSKSAYCKTSLPGEQQIVPFNQTIETNTGGKQDKISPDVSTTQPDVLSSVKKIAECLIDSTMETLGNLQQFNQTEQTVYSQTRDDQNPLSTTSKFWQLPLSLKFAVQLVERFGSPGVPLDTLLPDDYVVPLDWETSKQMYLHWKTSVEKKQKNSISKEDSALPAGVTILEDSNKEGQERQEPYEVNLQKVLEETSLL